MDLFHSCCLSLSLLQNESNHSNIICKLNDYVGGMDKDAITSVDGVQKRARYTSLCDSNAEHKSWWRDANLLWQFIDDLSESAEPNNR